MKRSGKKLTATQKARRMGFPSVVALARAAGYSRQSVSSFLSQGRGSARMRAAVETARRNALDARRGELQRELKRVEKEMRR